MRKIRIEWRKLRVLRRLDMLEAEVKQIERYMGMREPAVAGCDTPSQPLRRSSPEGRVPGDESGEKAPTAEEIMMMWRYTPEEIADMSRDAHVGGDSR